jgi:hypothetical protein
MMHEYPRNSIVDSVSESRVNALAGFGFTQRQREFLVTVMVHAGCFLKRQYCAFTGTVRGQNSREFVARLVARGFARTIEPGPVRRGRLCHVHHKPLYEAIGLPDDRNRPLHSIGRMVERVMTLDAVLGDRRCWWLSPAEDRRTFFDARETGLRDDEYPHISFGAGGGKIIRCFPDKLPIGIDKEDTGRIVFLYLVTRRIPIDFRQFLIRHHTLFLNLHTWTVRLLVPRRFRKAVSLYKAALREQLWTPLDPSVSRALETYFRERKERGGHLGDTGDRFIAQARYSAAIFAIPCRLNSLPSRWPQSAATGSFTPALVVSPVAVVSDPHERAARMHVIMSERAGTTQFVIRSQIASARVAIFPGKTVSFGTQISRLTPSRLRCSRRAQRRQCSSLRFDPADGRAFGLDDACARHMSGSYAMEVRVMVSRMALTRESRRSMLASSRQCRTAYPPFAPRANGARIRPAPTGHVSSAFSSLRRSRTCSLVSCEHRDLSRCIVLRTVRRQRWRSPGSSVLARLNA